MTKGDNINLKKLSTKEKFQYIWDYYKLHILICLIVIYIIGYALHGFLIDREPVLYTGFVNINASEDLCEQLSSGFLEFINKDPSKEDLILYTGLYLTEDDANPYFEYTYASRMKILATIDSETLDIVLMNKEAFDAFSQNGYLCNLEKLLLKKDPALYEKAKVYLVNNTIILEDNLIEAQLDSSIAYQAKTEILPFGLDLSQTGLICEAGFDDTVYLGVIENSTRKEITIDYIKYLLWNKKTTST